jgi:hypothetical protein
MRTLSFDAVRQDARARSAAVRVAVGLDSRRDQPHDDEQWQALMRVDQERLQRWLATGKLKILGPRRFALS